MLAGCRKVEGDFAEKSTSELGGLESSCLGFQTGFVQDDMTCWGSDRGSRSLNLHLHSIPGWVDPTFDQIYEVRCFRNHSFQGNVAGSFKGRHCVELFLTYSNWICYLFFWVYRDFCNHRLIWQDGYVMACIISDRRGVGRRAPLPYCRRTYEWLEEQRWGTWGNEKRWWEVGGGYVVPHRFLIFSALYSSSKTSMNMDEYVPQSQ